MIGKIARKAAGLASAAVLALGCMAPAVALAEGYGPWDDEPDGTYDGHAYYDEESAADVAGGGTTELYLIRQVDNMADNNGNYAKANLRVQVPVALNFVADSTGAIAGPADAKLRNFSGVAVHVANVQYDPAEGTTVGATTAASLGADQIAMKMGVKGEDDGAVSGSEIEFSDAYDVSEGANAGHEVTYDGDGGAA